MIQGIAILRAEHRLVFHPAIELLSADLAQHQRRLLETQLMGVGVLGDQAGSVVADRWGEGGDQHQALIQGLLTVIETPEAMDAYLMRAQSQDDAKRRAHRCVEAAQEAARLVNARGWLKAADLPLPPLPQA